MPVRSTSFQRLIALIHSCLAGKVAESAMLKDMDTGENREVDILITSCEANYKFLIGIEVVEWKRKADVPWVEKMIQKHNRLPTNKLILISKSGFTKPALKKANAQCAETVELELALDTNWDLAVKLIGGGIFKLLDIRWECMILPIGCEECIKPKKTDLIILPDQIVPVHVGVFAQNLVNLPFVSETIFRHAKGNTHQEFHIVFNQIGSKYKAKGKPEVEIYKVFINMKSRSSSKPFDFSMKSLKGNEFGIGESKNAKDKFCFAIQQSADGRTVGAIYDDGKIRKMRSP